MRTVVVALIWLSKLPKSREGRNMNGTTSGKKTTVAPSPLKILHVLGSPSNEWCFKLSIFYAGAFDQSMGNGKFVSTFALIQPNGNWSFADDMSAFVVDKQTDEKGQTSLANVDIISALSHIKNVVMPDAAIVHLVCEKGNNTYRAMFQALDIPLIGGGFESRFISSDKVKTRNCVSATVRCAEAKIFQKGDGVKQEKISYPCVVKASRGEDSCGVRLVRSPSLLNEAIENALRYSDTFYIERFIRGREVRTGVIKSVETGELRPLSCLEYDIDMDGMRETALKYQLEDGLPAGVPKNAASWFLDPSKDGELIEKTQQESLKAFRALGLEDFGLFDYRVDENGDPWFLESNIFCSFSPRSKLNMLAKNSGISDEELFVMMVKNALLRAGKPIPANLRS